MLLRTRELRRVARCESCSPEQRRQIRETPLHMSSWDTWRTHELPQIDREVVSGRTQGSASAGQSSPGRPERQRRGVANPLLAFEIADELGGLLVQTRFSFEAHCFLVFEEGLPRRVLQQPVECHGRRYRCARHGHDDVPVDSDDAIPLLCDCFAHESCSTAYESTSGTSSISIVFAPLPVGLTAVIGHAGLVIPATTASTSFRLEYRENRPRTLRT